MAQWKQLSTRLPDIDATDFSEGALTLISVFDLINGMSLAKGDMVKNANTVQRAAQARQSAKPKDGLASSMPASARGAVSDDGRACDPRERTRPSGTVERSTFFTIFFFRRVSFLRRKFCGIYKYIYIYI